MASDAEKKNSAILKIIAESSGPIGSVEIAEKLKEQGIELSERTVRYHMKSMGEQGLLKVFWKEGRMITGKGREEVNNAFVFDKVGLMSSRIETMAYKMDFDLYQKSGNVILNVSLINKTDFKKAVAIMTEVFKANFSTGEMVAVAEEGAQLGGLNIPAGKVGFGTLCSINLNGILLKHSIPIESKFGGLLQVENQRPTRFTDLINYSGSTLDPHEIFIKSKMTNVKAAAAGSGKILAGLREIPSVSRDEAEAIIRKTESAGIGRAIFLGRAGQEVMGMPVGQERVGIVVPGGLNPIAAVEECGIETESKALQAMVDYKELINFWEI